MKDWEARMNLERDIDADRFGVLLEELERLNWIIENQKRLDEKIDGIEKRFVERYRRVMFFIGLVYVLVLLWVGVIPH